MSKPNLIRKFFCLWLFLVAANAFADNLNIYGQSGFHKTQSAKTLGHGRFGLGFFLEGSGIGNIIRYERFCQQNDSPNTEPECFFISNYTGGNAYPFLSFGLSDYFDFGISIPLYGEYLRIKNDEQKFSTDNLSAGGWGDLLISSKTRVPFDEKVPLDLALILAFYIATGRQDLGETNNYGPWVRDPAFLHSKENQPLVPGKAASSYTNTNHRGKVGVAATFDFGKMKHSAPLLAHLNWGYRWNLGEGGNNYPSVQNLAAALELTPVEFLTLSGEFYTDISKNFGFMDLSTATFGMSFHLSKAVDIQLGAQFLLGGKYIDSLTINAGEGTRAFYSGRPVPRTLAFGGLTFKLSVLKEEEEWEEEYRNPDTDGDGVCDPWVRETGRQREFANVCGGIDLCPYEEGPVKNKGCPYEEVAEAAPTVVFSVNPEVVAEGQSATLKWITTNADGASIEGIGAVSLQGSRRVNPKETTTYTITATGAGGTRTESVEVIVEAASGPSIVFSASHESIQPGQSATLNWMVSDADEVSIEGIGSVPDKGSRRVKPTETTSYVIVATGKGGTRREMVEIVVESALPGIIFTASAESVQKGQSVTLNWTVTNASEVNLEGIGPVQAQGSRRVKMSASRTFILTATGPGGTQTATVDVEAEEIARQVNLKGVNFLSGKAELTLDARRVLDDVAEQLLASPEVKIEIHGHTDSQGNAKSNQDLSERRAKAVVSYLASKGVKANRMRSAGFGSDVPIADNKTSEGRELNRRIEMIRVD
jgi:outer membrane protein OmpA-like peptidoglycan-associated protein